MIRYHLKTSKKTLCLCPITAVAHAETGKCYANNRDIEEAAGAVKLRGYTAIVSAADKRLKQCEYRVRPFRRALLRITGLKEAA